MYTNAETQTSSSPFRNDLVPLHQGYHIHWLTQRKYGDGFGTDAGSHERPG